MIRLTSELLDEISSSHEPPYLSLYLPTHRHFPENQQDPIRFRNLVKELGAALRQRYPAVDAQPLLAPFEALSREEIFWRHTLDGLAVLGRPGFFQAWRIPQPVAEMAAVGDSFHTNPLRRFLQSMDRFQVLGLSLNKIRLFEGNRHALEELELAQGVPRTIEDALGVELTEPHQTTVSYGGVGASNRIHHSHGGKADEADSDAERFFRVVDRAVLESYSKPSGLPLLLAALPEHHHPFHQVSQNPFLIEDGIRVNPDALSIEELRVLAWQTIEPRYQARLTSLCEEFEEARAKGVGRDNLAQVAEASIFGRVATLLIEADRQIAGRLNGATGRVEQATPEDPEVHDLLGDLGEVVAKKGGEVVVVPAERMPSRTGLAATYRY